MLYLQSLLPSGHSSRCTFFLAPVDEPTKLKDNCLPCHVVDNVKTMVLFVGYPRSCHSLVGSLLDAHPNMVIAHEYNLLGKWRKMADVNRTRKHIFNDLYRWSHQQQATIRQLKNGQSAVARYLYGVPNQWQGDYKDRVTVRRLCSSQNTAFFALVSFL